MDIKDFNCSIFYLNDLSTGKIIWFGNTDNFLGLKEKELKTREDFINLLPKKEHKSYQFNMENFTEEISCEYTIRVNGKIKYIREIAIKTENNGKEVIQGIVAENPSGKIRKDYNKYNVSTKSILSGKFDSDFLESLKKFFEKAESNKENYILMLVSIDNIPMILNWQGNDVVDKVMNDIAKKIKEKIPSGSAFQRISTDQFGLIIKNPVANEIDNITNEINYLINIYKNPNFEDTIHLRLSIGSAQFPLGVKNEFDVINKAYLALTNVKGKDYEFYCDFEDAKREHIDTQNEMTQLHYLQEAYHDNRLELAFQPIIASANGEVDSYEALLRINEGSYYSSAGRFIPIAEKMGTVDVIDEFVLRKVVEELQKAPDLSIAINVSSLTTSNDNWLKMCTKVLTDENIASRLYVEITETAAQKDLRKTAYFTASMQALGCSVALDDFGVGYTSFRQLRSLSVDTVKIDGSYILGIEENKENMIFIRSLVDFSRSYGLRTIAECVETGEVAKILMKLGIELLQGYYFGKPEVSRPWLEKNSSKKYKSKAGLAG